MTAPYPPVAWLPHTDGTRYPVAFGPLPKGTRYRIDASDVERMSDEASGSGQSSIAYIIVTWPDGTVPTEDVS